MTDEARSPWWRGERGEWYVAAQVALMLLVFFGPRHTSVLPRWSAAVAAVATVPGIALLAAGAALLLAGGVRLGRNLTPLPFPREGGVLRQTGAYAIVRHPMYAGGIALAFGYALVVHGWLTLAYAGILLVFADVKASREERWLVAEYPEYPEYRRRVKKLIPLIR